MNGWQVFASLVFTAGALLLAWRGIAGAPRRVIVRYGLVWLAIIGGLVGLLTWAGSQ